VVLYSLIERHLLLLCARHDNNVSLDIADFQMNNGLFKTVFSFVLRKYLETMIYGLVILHKLKSVSP
jgi:hypothetical protein